MNAADIPVIRAYFDDPVVREKRAEMGLAGPTDVELEYVSQARSDHCNHNTFGGRYSYTDLATGQKTEIGNLFKECIKAPTEELAAKKDWVVSVLWDNAGVAKLDDEFNYAVTGETHNSPSNMEAYGGSITGIVGVYRDPMGTGLGSKLCAGMWGFCVGPRDYDGELKPLLHPRRLLDGLVEGVRDGGNKSGIPTALGSLIFDPRYLGKCLVFVSAVGVMPADVGGKPSHLKETHAGELVIMCGGRVGADGIHRRHRLQRRIQRQHSGRSCADRRPLHPEEDARLFAGGPGRRPDPLHHRQRRRRPVPPAWAKAPAPAGARTWTWPRCP